MKPDDFEEQLRRQPMRAVPPEWRTGILEAARAAAAGDRGDEASRSAPAWLGFSRWREWLWPNPQAWGALAAIWLLIAGLNLAPDRPVARRSPAPVGGADSTLAEQRRELARLLDLGPETAAEPAAPPPRTSPMKPPLKSPPGPRSEGLAPGRA